MSNRMMDLFSEQDKALLKVDNCLLNRKGKRRASEIRKRQDNIKRMKAAVAPSKDIGLEEALNLFNQDSSIGLVRRSWKGKKIWCIDKSSPCGNILTEFTLGGLETQCKVIDPTSEDIKAHDWCALRN